MTELIIGGILIIVAIIIYKVKSNRVEKPEINSTVLPTPPTPPKPK